MKAITLLLELNDGFEATKFKFNSVLEVLEAIKNNDITSEEDTSNAEVYFKTENSDGLLCDFEDLQKITLNDLKSL